MIFTPVQAIENKYLKVKLIGLLLNLDKYWLFIEYIQVWMTFDKKKKKMLIRIK